MQILGDARESGFELTWMKEPARDDANPWASLGKHNIDAAQAQLLNTIGKERFDTQLVRSLVYVANGARLMRAQLDKTLLHYDTVLVSSDPIVNRSITEFDTNPRLGANERTDQHRYNSDNVGL